MSELKPKVFVSGCFDLLHSGHFAFFEEAATYGDLYVSIGSDKTILDLKGHLPIYTEEERLYMVKSVCFVKQAYIARGSGMLDFVSVFEKVQPNIFFVNHDGDTPAKMQLCKQYDAQYIVSNRKPKTNLPARSTTSLRQLII